MIPRGRAGSVSPSLSPSGQLAEYTGLAPASASGPSMIQPDPESEYARSWWGSNEQNESAANDESMPQTVPSTRGASKRKVRTGTGVEKKTTSRRVKVEQEEPPGRGAVKRRKRRAGGGADSDGSDGEAVSEIKRKQRLEKNKQNSREFRQRQKNYIAELEARVERLERENHELKSHHAEAAVVTSRSAENGASSTVPPSLGDNVGQEFRERVAGLFKMVEEWEKNNPDTGERVAGVGAPAWKPIDKELSAHLNAIEKDLSCYGSVRLDALTFHLQSINRLLIQLPHTKFLMWGLHQDDAFFDQSAQHGGIFHVISELIGISKLQLTRIKQLRPLGVRAMKQARESMVLLSQLQKSIQKHTSLTAELLCHELADVFPPLQQTKFFHFLVNNEALVSMLAAVLPTDVATEDSPANLDPLAPHPGHKRARPYDQTDTTTVASSSTAAASSLAGAGLNFGNFRQLNSLDLLGPHAPTEDVVVERLVPHTHDNHPALAHFARMEREEAASNGNDASTSN